MQKHAALYCRLSVDDGSFGGSVSIDTQKILLEQYCQSHEITSYEFYCDDGYSGTNFNRPAFQRMLTDIHADKINTVIVKDLSRFGRNYVEVGLQVEHFKEQNVRFIAADDHYDSTINEDDLMFPMRNVMNEMYARYVSKKTKAAKKAKAKAGQYIGSKPPFGYKLDPNDRHHLVIDEPAAEVVRRIFRLTADGAGYNKITRVFREEKVMNPITYFNQNNSDYFKADYWRKEFDWHVTSVRAILNNEVYLGMLVYGKRRNKTMKSKQVVKNPREEWIIAENTHEPIITQELWDTAHKVMSSKRRPAKTGELQIFAGLIYCADCGHCLAYGKKKRKDGSYYGAYDCWMYRTHGKEYCPSHYINYDTVYNLVLINLRTVLWNYRNNAQQFKSILERKFQTDSAKEAKKLQADYEKKQSRFEEIDKILCKLYEDSALGKIPESRYEAMSAQYEIEQREIKESLPDLRQQVEQLKAESDATDKFVNLIKKYTVIDQLDAAILNELIDKIVVHHKEIAEDGRVFQQVEIYYRFIGKLENAAESKNAA